MRYDLKLIYEIGNDDNLERIIFDNRYEIRRGEVDTIYDARYPDKIAQNVPDYMFSEGIQNVIKNIWKN
jgi:hypothetical protein